jgi:XTP/dITP diphosphohydrolase
METYILASNNKNKLREYKEKLSEFGIDVISQAEAGINIEVEETGTTFAENAELKAKAIYDLVKKPVISDDSGLSVDALGGDPGVFSHRFAGPTDQDRINKILTLLENVDDEKRTAHFTCAICFIDENGKEHIFEEKCEGTIARKQEGENGFGYDPIFLYEGKTFADISSEEKNEISHRGRAIKSFVNYIRNKNQ